VAAALAACQLPIQSAKWQVMPGSDESEPGYQFAKQLADFVEANLFGGLETPLRTGGYQTQTFKQVISNALLALTFGCAAHEELWDVDGDRIRLRQLAPRLPITFYRWWVDEDGYTLLALEQLGYRRNEYVNVIIPAQKLCNFAVNQEGGNALGRSLLRPAYLHWFFSDVLMRLDGIAAEHNAAGVPTFIQHEGASPDDVDTMKRFAKNVAGHEAQGFTLPHGAEFKLVGVEGKLYDIRPSLEFHSDKIYMSVLAGFLTLGKTHTGSYAVGDTLGDFFNLAENTHAETIADRISDTDIKRLIDYNFSVPKGLRLARMPYPKLKASKIGVMNPLQLIEKLRWAAQDNVDLIHPDDGIENWLREYLGAPLIDKPRDRYKAIGEMIRQEESPKPGSPGIVPEGDKGRITVGPQKRNGGVFSDRNFGGVRIHVENEAGSVRSGTDPSGKRWKVRMTRPYGEIPDTVGADGDALDVFLGPDEKAPYAYIFKVRSK